MTVQGCAGQRRTKAVFIGEHLLKDVCVFVYGCVDVVPCRAMCTDESV
jgi:hypothetical protein